ncbi:MAG: hypothetical protein VW518_01965 [Burkholderiaceae bacterium]|jgi:hypothetical protein
MHHDRYITANHRLLREEFAADLAAAGVEREAAEQLILEAEMEADLRALEEARHAAA